MTERLITAIIVVVGVPTATVLYVYLVEQLLRRFTHRTNERLRPWLWAGPALLLLIFYLIYPTINTIYISFMNADSTAFVGLDNYIFSFSADDMLTALRNNVLWVIFFTGFTVVFGMLIALLADRVRYETAVKTLIFIPMAISYVAAGVIWKLMYEFEPPAVPQTGTVNAVLTALIPNFEPQAWLVNRPENNFALIAIGVWMWTGFAMIILSAGLKSIPEELVEAARIDGANELAILRHITIPLLSSTIAVVITTMVINVLKVFDIPYLMTNGNFETEVIALRMYKEMFNFRHFGRAAAIATILLVFIAPIMVYNVRRFRQQEETR